MSGERSGAAPPPSRGRDGDGDPRGASASPAYPHLFSPLALGPSLRLRNRVVFSPHTTGFAEPGGWPGAREAAYQGARAVGGVALTVLGTSAVHPSSSTDYGVLSNMDDRCVAGFRLVAEAVHAGGAALFAQLNHQGLAAAPRGPGRPLVGPSPVPSPIHGEVPREAPPALLQEIVAAFAAAAARCRLAGLDGVLVHAAHGFLLNQFLSPLTNRRTDDYGGSLENRMRLLRETLAAVRAAVPPGFVVGVRVSADELVPGGMRLEESLALVRRLDADRLVDYVDVSTGVDWDWLSKARHYPGMHWPEETWVEMAAAVKAAVKVPVACAGRLRAPDQAERLLAAGSLDLVQMARALIADPAWVDHARLGRAEEIRPCLYVSSGCLGRVERGLPIRCVQNPLAGREGRPGRGPVEPATRRLVVVGGGPAGLHAALAAAERGHRVVLLEREAALGGQQRLAAQAPGREDLLRGLEYLERQLTRLGVQVRLGAAASVRRVLAERAEHVILATGSEPAALDVRGGSRALSVRDALAGLVPSGVHALVVDGLGRMQAASVADWLAVHGHQVTIVTRDYAVGAHIDATTRPAVERRLREGGVHQLAGHEVTAITRGSARLRDCFTGREWTLEGIDAVVHDVGALPRADLAEELVAAGIEVQRVGDALAPRGLEEATHEGYWAAQAL